MDNTIQIPEPKLSRFLFSDTRIAWLWLIVRLYVGYVWIMAGYAKFMNPAWVGENAGKAISGFFTGAIAKATGQYPQVSAWYASFLSEVALPNAVLFSYLITCGEILVGIGLIVGLFTGIAAFFGSLLNYNFLLAGAVGPNPVLLFLQIFLMLAWRNAGWIGLDRFALPKIGVPWKT